jgi:hypothetical protein
VVKITSFDRFAAVGASLSEELNASDTVFRFRVRIDEKPEAAANQILDLRSS